MNRPGFCGSCHEAPVHSRGRCRGCYQRQRKAGTLERTAESWGTMHTDGQRCRCGLRLSTPAELASKQCSDCLPAGLYEFIEQRMSKQENA
jgi:hypothetical protein